MKFNKDSVLNTIKRRDQRGARGLSQISKERTFSYAEAAILRIETAERGRLVSDCDIEFQRVGLKKKTYMKRSRGGWVSEEMRGEARLDLI